MFFSWHLPNTRSIIWSMGDTWEEDRLARRDEYAIKHRLKINQLDSERWNYLQSANRALMEELGPLAIKFRQAISQIASLGWVSTEQTLRQAYTHLSNQSLLTILSPQLGGEINSDYISDKSKEDELFGTAVACISGINRCIRDCNQIRALLYEFEIGLYRHVYPDTTMEGHIRWGETATIVDTDGRTHVLNQPSNPSLLKEISFDLSISALRLWKAADYL